MGSLWLLVFECEKNRNLKLLIVIALCCCVYRLLLLVEFQASNGAVNGRNILSARCATMTQRYLKREQCRVLPCNRKSYCHCGNENQCSLLEGCCSLEFLEYF